MEQNQDLHPFSELEQKIGHKRTVPSKGVCAKVVQSKKTMKKPSNLTSKGKMDRRKKSTTKTISS